MRQLCIKTILLYFLNFSKNLFVNPFENIEFHVKRSIYWNLNFLVKYCKSNTGSLEKKKDLQLLWQIAAASAIVYIFYRPRQWTPTSLPSKFGHFAGILDIWWSHSRSGILQFVNRLIDMSNREFQGQLFKTKRKVVLRRFLVVFQEKSIKKRIKQGPNNWPETTWCSRESL